MKAWKKKLVRGLGILLALVLSLAALILWIPMADYGFARAVPEAEARLRLDVVSEAESWLGAAEGEQRHLEILEIYNSHQPLAQSYTVLPEDNWCAAFASAVAIRLGLTEIVPTECGCERQIGLFADIDRWQEKDTYLPLPGDYIFYAWGDSPLGDCTGWADHVGIVAGTWGPFIKVIEGNKDDCVSVRYTTRWDPTIRGYGLPDYAGNAQ